MALLKVSIKMEDSDLEKAIKFIHANPDHLELIKEDYFSKDIEIDFSTVKDQYEKYYHMNGLVAMLIELQNTFKITENPLIQQTT